MNRWVVPLWCLVLAGCAAKHPPGEAVLPTKPESRILSPALAAEDRQALEAAAKEDIQATERILADADVSGEPVTTARSLLAQAREALGSDDPVRARNLAQKARRLVDELPR